MIKAVIYDLDDLTVNSDPLHVVAWDKLLEKYGHKYSDLPKNLHANFMGMRVIDEIETIHDYFYIKDEASALYKKRIAIFLGIAKDQLQMMPGLKESLDLFQKNNFKMAIGSSGVIKYIRLVLNKFKLHKYFKVIVSGDDVKKGKPDPEVYLTACQKLKMKPEECVVLEDAAKGIQAAKAAGCKCIAIKNPNTPPQDRSQADLILNSLNEITLQLIKSL